MVNAWDRKYIEHCAATVEAALHDEGSALRRGDFLAAAEAAESAERYAVAALHTATGSLFPALPSAHRSPLSGVAGQGRDSFDTGDAGAP